MSQSVLLHDIATARAGDKGNISSVSVWMTDPRHYEPVRAVLTPALLKREFGATLTGDIIRYELPDIHALHFVMHDALEGGVNGSLNLDAHGKSWGYMLLGLRLDLPGS